MWWPFKKKNSKPKETKPQGPIVIPEPIITADELKYDADGHDNFNVLCESKDGTMYRVLSKSSHKVATIVMSYFNNDFGVIPYNDDFSIYYLKKSERWYTVRSLFVTDNENFFYQDIQSDGKIKYFIISRESLHADIKLWEDLSKPNLYYSDFYYKSKKIYPAGTYDSISNLPEGKLTHEYESYVNSFEVKDKERYEKLIDVL